MASKVTDAELVRRARAGDQESLERLMECVWKRVYPHIRRVTRDEHESEDLAQETLLRVLGSLGRLRRIERFWPWVFRITANTIRQHCRYESRRRVVFLSIVDAVTLEMREARRSEDSCRLEDTEHRNMLLSALSDVDERHRLVLVLRFFGQMPYAETARILGCSASNARSALFRAKRALRRTLTHRGCMEAMQVA